MIVDAHTHIWKSDPAWPDQTQTTVAAACEVSLELLTDYMDEFGVDRAVLVQPLYPFEENSYVAESAASRPERFASVCVVDPQRNDAAEELERWVREAGCRGLRLRPVAKDEEASFGHVSSFPIWEKAEALSIPINILMHQGHVATLDRVAVEFPHVPVIVDHLGHPPVQQGVGNPAIQEMLALARHPQVHMKISGFYYYSTAGYPYTDCREIVETLFQSFGPDRLIWGSDFPHVLLKTGYKRAVDCLVKILPNISARDHGMIMGENALRLYWPE